MPARIVFEKPEIPPTQALAPAKKKQPRHVKIVPRVTQVKKKKQNWLFPSMVIVALVVLVFLVRTISTFSLDMSRPLVISQKGIFAFSGQVNSITNVVVEMADHSGSETRFILLSLNTIDKRMVLVEIPRALSLTVPLGYGVHELGKISSLAPINPDFTPIKSGLAALALGELFAVPIDGYVTVEKSCQETSLKACIEQILGQSLWKRGIPFVKSDSLSSNFSLWRLGALALKIGGIRTDRVKEVSLKDQGFVREKEQLMTVDEGELDRFVQRNFADPVIENASATIEVLNGTEHDGLGGLVGRYVTNLGGKLVHIGNFDRTDVKESVVIGNKSTISDKLAAACRCAMIEQHLVSRRGDVLIVVGEDYWHKLNGR